MKVTWHTTGARCFSRRATEQEYEADGEQGRMSNFHLAQQPMILSFETVASINHVQRVYGVEFLE